MTGFQPPAPSSSSVVSSSLNSTLSTTKSYATSRPLLLDNGSDSLKLGYVGEAMPRWCIPNCMAHPSKKQGPRLFGEQCYNLHDSYCHRPYQQGLLVDPDLQREIWDHLFSKVRGGIHTFTGTDCGICVTEPYLFPSVLRHTLCEILFEDFNFQTILICPSQIVANYSFFDLQVWPYPSESKSPFFQSMNPSISSSHISNNSQPVQLYAYHHPSTSIPPIPQSKFMYRNPCALLLDCGMANLHAVPSVDFHPIQNGCLRSSIGGAHLNSVLKQLLQHRTIQLLHNDLLVQHIKEKSGFVSSNFMEQLKQAQTEYRSAMGAPGQRASQTHLYHEMELPDYNVKNKSLIHHYFNDKVPFAVPFSSSTMPSTSKLNSVKKDSFSHDGIEKGILNGSPPSQDSQSLVTPSMYSPNLPGVSLLDEKPKIGLTNERICIPEILFKPQDYFPGACGAAELLYRSMSLCPPEIQPLLAKQISVVGGSASFPGFVERLWCDLRSLLPQDWELCIYRHDRPSYSVWVGASLWASDEYVYNTFSISKSTFLEKGSYDG